MNKVRKSISLLLIVILVLTSASVVFASDSSSSVSTVSGITWNYTVYDQDGQIIKQGTMPSSGGIQPNYSWSGVALANNEAVLFTPTTNSKGLYCEKGIEIKTKYTLSRSASHRSFVSGYTSGGGYTYEGTSSGRTYYFDAAESDYYYGFLRNLSSDTITVKSFSITF